MTYPDISVPEALHTLAYGSREKKVAAAEALAGIVTGEVQILEEILSDANAEHVPLPPDGRNIFRILVDDLAAESFDGAEAIAGLLANCTEYDLQWDDEDEWNELTGQVLEFLRKDPKVAKQLEAGAAIQNAKAAAMLKAVVERVAGDRKALVPLDVADSPAVRPLWLRIPGAIISGTWSVVSWPVRRVFRLGGSSGESGPPDMSSVNMRVQCMECSKYFDLKVLPAVTCVNCNSIGWCCEEHKQKDAFRHSTWCFAIEKT